MHTTQLRVGTTAEWADTDATDNAAAPVLEAGELGLDTTTGHLRVGDGTTAFPSLPSAFRQSKVGTTTLVGGTKTVTVAGVAVGDIVVAAVRALGTVTVAKALSAVAGSGNIVITSADATDTSVVAYFVVKP